MVPAVLSPAERKRWDPVTRKGGRVFIRGLDGALDPLFLGRRPLLYSVVILAYMPQGARYTGGTGHALC